MIKLDGINGKRIVDFENKMVELKDGSMASYVSIEMKHIDGDQYFALMINKNSGVPIDANSYREHFASLISDEQKEYARKERIKANIMSEGYGDY